LSSSAKSTNSPAAPTDQVISAATNRGHKLARGASHVHARALPYFYGSEVQKQVCRNGHSPAAHAATELRSQKIDHAGYTRYILQRNPIRTNEEGDVLEDDESDADADADVEDENPYAGIRLEGIGRRHRLKDDR
jgi:hypothetical protein